MIMLSAVADQEYSGQQYVARILGLDPQGTFRYERVGYSDSNVTNAYAVSSGFYAVCDVDSEGNKHESYHIITTIKDAWASVRSGIDNVEDSDGKEAAIRIAKRLELGESLEQIVGAQSAAGDTEATAAKKS